MLNKKELLIVNEVVNKLAEEDNAKVVIDPNTNDIILLVNDLVDDIYTNREKFLNDMIQCLKIDTKTTPKLRQKEATNHLNYFNVLLTGEKIKITNNDFNILSKNLANQYYTNFSLYDAILDLFDVLPFKINTTNELLNKVINFYCNTEEQRQYKTLYRGFTNSENTIYKLKNDLNLSTIYDGGYNVCLYNDNLKLIVEYTEGDFNFSISDTIDLFKKEKQKTIDFYNNNY